MIVEGCVEILKCADCEAVHPQFLFVGDTDMVTYGLTSAGDREGRKLCLFDPFYQSAGAALSDDLRTAALVSSIPQFEPKPGESFAKFRERYVPRKAYYRCPWCEHDAMSVTEEIGPKEFCNMGGTIELAGKIEAIREFGQQ